MIGCEEIQRMRVQIFCGLTGSERARRMYSTSPLFPSVCPKPLLRRCPLRGPEQGLAPNLTSDEGQLCGDLGGGCIYSLDRWNPIPLFVFTNETAILAHTPLGGYQYAPVKTEEPGSYRPLKNWINCWAGTSSHRRPENLPSSSSKHGLSAA
jgi:hypothetical protein